jgi:cytochrome c biogenesis protein CcmG/thiol:disulfide interchange protein DsbE
MGRMKRLSSPFAIATILGVVALVGLLAYGLTQTGPDRSIDEALAKGERRAAPTFTIDRLEGGGKAALTSYRGKVVVLNFWASWCEPCREESPLLERWNGKLKEHGGTVLGVDVLDLTGDAREFIRKFKLTYPQLHDSDGNVLGKYGVVAYPETFVIDQQGRIAANRRGVVDDEFMRQKVQPLLRKGS